MSSDYLEDFKQRLLEEKQQIEQRIIDLKKWLARVSGSDDERVPLDDANLIVLQIKFMEGYVNALEGRVAKISMEIALRGGVVPLYKSKTFCDSSHLCANQGCRLRLTDEERLEARIQAKWICWDDFRSDPAMCVGFVSFPTIDDISR
jgi:hypothetical protein